MAILWSKHISGKHYQVRSAGQTRRLYTDGVFHSQYRPQKATAGGVWDLLMLPALLKAGPVRRVLVLGVGGGAVIKLLQKYFNPEKIVGIDNEKVHLQIARKFFSVKGRGLELIHADALQWVKDYRGEKFDLVIDDLFFESAGEPARVIEPSRYWVKQLYKHLDQKGIVVMNLVDKHQLFQLINLDLVKSYFESAFRFSITGYENLVVALSRQKTGIKILKQNISRQPGLIKSISINNYATGNLHVSCRSISI